MTTEIVTTGDFYHVAELTDEKQIMNIDEFKNILCYKDSKSGKYELSYNGIKHLVLEMAAKGMPLEVVDAKYELLGDGVEKTWYTSVWVKNLKTGLTHDGHSEAPYYENNGRHPLKFVEPFTKDSFARTKAFSKAKRNACKAHLPQALIIHLVNQATTKGQTKELKTVHNEPDEMPEEAQDYCNCDKPNRSFSGLCMNTGCGKQVK